MAKILKKCICIPLIFITAICGLQVNGQLTVMGQLRTRTEFRDGLGTLILKTNSPSFFTSQRSRLTFNYKTSRVIFQTSLQDIRVWGQDASTISNADGSKLAGKSIEYAKNITPNTANLTGLWSYLMITIKPEFLFK